ncbi:hypothetical protein CSUI_008398, partial [Cystoisospora suis]
MRQLSPRQLQEVMAVSLLHEGFPQIKKKRGGVMGVVLSIRVSARALSHLLVQSSSLHPQRRKKISLTVDSRARLVARDRSRRQLRAGLFPRRHLLSGPVYLKAPPRLSKQWNPPHPSCSPPHA